MTRKQIKGGISVILAGPIFITLCNLWAGHYGYSTEIPVSHFSQVEVIGILALMAFFGGLSYGIGYFLISIFYRLFEKPEKDYL